jgi:Xaa-Pro aminopeptidase
MAKNPAFQPTAVPLPEEARATQVLREYVPQLSHRERDRRWDRIRKKMLMSGIDALLLLGNDIYWGMGMANLRYLLQVDSQIGADGLFPLAGEPVVWNGLIHMNRPTNIYLSLQDWITDLRTRGGLPAIIEEIRARGLDRSRLGLVGFSSVVQTTRTLLHDDMVNLRKQLPDVDWVDANPMLQEMRMVKSEEEIGMLRAAGGVARKVIDTMTEYARPGVREAELYAQMICTQIANGAEPNVFNLFASGPVEHPRTELWHLLHGCEQPASPTLRPLEAGDIVIAEWHTKYGGYRCHTEYTRYLGKNPPAQLRRIWDVSVECLEASRHALVVGRTLKEAIDIIWAPAKRAKLDSVELGFHAMGTASPEWPNWVYPEGFGPNTLNGHQIGDMVLESGMTFGNNIDLHDSRWKPDVGCMLSDFMVVRPERAESLIGVPLEFPASA